MYPDPRPGFLEQAIAGLPPIAVAAGTRDPDAFAIALHDFLQSQHVDSRLLSVERTRLTDAGELMDDRHREHMVVEAWGQTWDAMGSRADDRFESSWPQPSLEDTGEPAMDSFSVRPVCRDALMRLRESHARHDQPAYKLVDAFALVLDDRVSFPALYADRPRGMVQDASQDQAPVRKRERDLGRGM